MSLLPPMCPGARPAPTIIASSPHHTRRGITGPQGPPGPPGPPASRAAILGVLSIRNQETSNIRGGYYVPFDTVETVAGITVRRVVSDDTPFLALEVPETGWYSSTFCGRAVQGDTPRLGVVEIGNPSNVSTTSDALPGPGLLSGTGLVRLQAGAIVGVANLSESIVTLATEIQQPVTLSLHFVGSG